MKAIFLHYTYSLLAKIAHGDLMPFLNEMPNDTKQLEEALELWCTNMSSGDPENIVNLFDSKAILLPTLAPNVLKTREEQLAYFTQLMQNPKLSVTVNESNLRIFGNIAINSGLYTFYFERQGQPVIIPARFTFIYQKKPQGWLIIEQHSSQVPMP